MLIAHVERPSKKRRTERVYVSGVKRRRVEGRLCTRWLDGVTRDFNAMSLEMRDAKVKCK